MKLRTLRILLAWIVMGLFLLVFIGGGEVPGVIAETLPRFQFVPSLIKFFLAAGGISSMAFLGIMAATLLFGRIYCASFCPLGLLQDLVAVVLRTGKSRQPARTVQHPHALIRYSILGLTLGASLLGSLAALNLLDPYSVFGRLATHLFKPVAIFLNNLLVSGLEHFDVYAVTPIAYHQIPVLILLSSFAVFLLLVVLTLVRGRMYCNTICPVGTLLGLLAHGALFKITLNQQTCISCGKCEQICRGGCINSKKGEVDASRCVVCFDCLSVCPTSALEYTSAFQRASRQHSSLDPARRKFLVKASAAFGALVLGSVPLRPWARPFLDRGASLPVSPPGSISLAQFREKCTACHLCVSACPSKIIQPAWFEYGLHGMMQPVLDYRQGFCAYECNTCGTVCPTGAIMPLSLAEKQRTQIGRARLVEAYCLVHAKQQECGACAEVCPTHAVYTEERNGILYPIMNVDLCIGCGACEFVCPQTPKAIFVEANPIHGLAQKPFYDQELPVQDTPLASPKDDDADFPF